MKTSFFHNRPKQKNSFQQLLQSKKEAEKNNNLMSLTSKEVDTILETASRTGKDNPLRLFQEGYMQGVHGTVEKYSAVVLLCLKDKFDFTSGQLQDVALHINETFDAINEEYLSLDDIVQTLKEEDGLDVRFKTNTRNKPVKNV